MFPNVMTDLVGLY